VTAAAAAVVAVVVERAEDQVADSRHGVAGQLHRRMDMRAADVDVDVAAAAAVAAGGRDLVAAQQRKGLAERRSRRQHYARRRAHLWHV
jgi:hypothetical protein